MTYWLYYNDKLFLSLYAPKGMSMHDLFAKAIKDLYMLDRGPDIALLRHCVVFKK
jgi:hypothetical protein